jgi:hypothetical protein
MPEKILKNNAHLPICMKNTTSTVSDTLSCGTYLALFSNDSMTT